MSDRISATVGFVSTGLAAAIAFDGWSGGLDGSTVVFLAALLATGTFLLRRYDLVDRAVWTPLGAGFATLVVIGALVWIGTGDLAELTVAELETSAIGPFVAAGLGIVGVVGAWADWTGLELERALTLSNRSAIAAAIGIAGILSISVWGVLVASGSAVVGFDPLDPFVRMTASTLGVGLGTVTVAAAVLSWSDRGFGYVDARLPDRRGWIYVVLGTVTLLCANVGIEFVFSMLGMESGTHSLVRSARDAPETLLVLIPLSYLVVGPGEELLYRNVVQKYLAEAFSGPGAILVASVIFASVHLPAYTGGGSGLLAVLNTLTIVFVLSVILGVAYARTHNVVVSALIHGSFNAVAFAVTYLELTNVAGALAGGALS